MKVTTQHERVSRQVFSYNEHDIYRLAERDAKASQLWAPKPDGAIESVTTEWGDDMTIRVVRTFTYPEE